MSVPRSIAGTRLSSWLRSLPSSRRSLAALLSCLTVTLGGELAAQSRLLYDNGPLMTGPHPAAPVAQSSLAQGSVAGFGANRSSGLALADDFTVCATSGMLVDAIELIGYALGAVPAPPAPVTGVFVELLTGPPGLPSSVPVPGGPSLDHDQLANSTVEFRHEYRVFALAPAATNRALMSVRVQLAAPVWLSPGTYWLVFQFNGLSWVPPLTTAGVESTGNARQRIGGVPGTWQGVVDGDHSQGLPFRLHGLAGGAVGQIARTSLPSCGAARLAVRGSPVLGGYVHAQLSNVGGLGFIGYGFQSSPQAFCGCWVGHEWASVVFGNSDSLEIPMTTALCNFEFRIQGADFLAAGGCANPPLAFTETWRVQQVADIAPQYSSGNYQDSPVAVPISGSVTVPVTLTGSFQAQTNGDINGAVSVALGSAGTATIALSPSSAVVSLGSTTIDLLPAMPGELVLHNGAVVSVTTLLDVYFADASAHGAALANWQESSRCLFAVAALFSTEEMTGNCVTARLLCATAPTWYCDLAAVAAAAALGTGAASLCSTACVGVAWVPIIGPVACTEIIPFCAAVAGAVTARAVYLAVIAHLWGCN
ncbi:MAG: hypothetical protein IPK26_28320 [Planctomycetes bacterium]|nr:hypothetical protein [Planctomycetota bacterium]